MAKIEEITKNYEMDWVPSIQSTSEKACFHNDWQCPRPFFQLGNLSFPVASGFLRGRAIVLLIFEEIGRFWGTLMFAGTKKLSSWKGSANLMGISFALISFLSLFILLFGLKSYLFLLKDPNWIFEIQFFFFFFLYKKKLDFY